MDQQILRQQEILNYIRRSTTTAEEVENMEKYISDLIQEKVKLKHKASECFTQLMFLIKQDLIKTIQDEKDPINQSDIFQQLAKDLYEFPTLIDKELII